LWPDLPQIMQANRAFLRRAVRYLASQGITQFLDIGSGIPTVGNVHEVAQAAAPDARVVYVDIDPVAVAHSRAIPAVTIAPTSFTPTCAMWSRCWATPARPAAGPVPPGRCADGCAAALRAR
jgi:hypothetical protein